MRVWGELRALRSVNETEGRDAAYSSECRKAIYKGISGHCVLSLGVIVSTEQFPKS